MYDINELINMWIIDTPYPHTNDQIILDNKQINDDVLIRLKNILSHVFESGDYIRKKHLILITEDSSSNDIKKIFADIRKDLVNKFSAENKEISESSYVKLINILIYNYFVH